MLADDTCTLTNIIYYVRVSLAFVDFGSSSFFTDWTSGLFLFRINSEIEGLIAST
jgi:hypothetical protein